VSNNKIGLFSGTFDPVHKGHIEFALKAQNECDLEYIYFMPEESPRRKERVTELQHRQNMLAIATASCEVLRVLNIGQERFSVEKTLPVLLSGFGGAELYFLLGDDAALRLGEWNGLDEMAATASFVVASRNHKASEIKKYLREVQETRQLRLDYEIVGVEANKISSGRIRQAVRDGSAQVEGVDEAVLEYIRDNQLYR
jgi:nicotinate-nucleotide adenylyltransferase